ncbi:MAG: hypothetical protein GWP04_04590 [Gammaproteobacteria bacterium]|nr:hypothetical protein [Gammaproteobacteria bacterium]
MSGTGCVQDLNTFPEYGHPGYTGSPVCDLGAAVTEWREVRGEVPGQPGAGAFAFLCYCDTSLDRNPDSTDLARCPNVAQLVEDSRIERGFVEPTTTTAQETATTEPASEPTSTTATVTSTTAPAIPSEPSEPAGGVPGSAAAVALVTVAGVMGQAVRAGVVRGKAGELVAKGDALPKDVRDKIDNRKKELRTRLRQRYQEALQRLRRHRIVRRPGEIVERGERRFREAQARLDRRSRRVEERLRKRGRETIDRIGRSRIVRRGRDLFDKGARGLARLRADYQAAQGLHTILTDRRRLQQEVDRGIERAVHRRLVGSGVSPLLVTGLGGERAIGNSVKRFFRDPRREFRRVGRTLRSPRNVVKEVGRGVRRVGRSIDKSPPAQASRFIFGRRGLGRLFRRRRRHR